MIYENRSEKISDCKRSADANTSLINLNVLRDFRNISIYGLIYLRLSQYYKSGVL